MKKLIILTLLFTLTALHAITHTVSLDGTADFTTIQSAINYSAHGDTIKVMPGRYYENINYNGKNVYVTSLFVYSNDRNDINNTIIDGNQQSACVIFMNNETRNAVLNGFIIEHGIGKIFDRLGFSGYMETWAGGGIYITQAGPSILNCIIQNNRVHSGLGGGIWVGDCFNNENTFLSGNIIKNNIASNMGGGVGVGQQTIATFDPVNKNSIFNNRAGLGHDILAICWNRYLSVPIDTFTVATEDPVFAAIYCNHTFSVEHHVIDNFINSDLYVANYGSDELNDGVTPETPFKTVSHALYWIESDPINPKTIYVETGVYSASSGQLFPAQMKSYITLTGAGSGQTIFDAEHNYERDFLTSVKGCCDYKIAGITFINTISLGNYQLASPLSLEGLSSLEVADCIFTNNYHGIITWASNFSSSLPPVNQNSVSYFKNLFFDNNISSVINLQTKKTNFENITITGNHSYWQSGLRRGEPPIQLVGWNNNNQAHTFSNILIYNNESFLDYDWNAPSSNAIHLTRNQNVLINNATITGNILNTGIQGGPMLLSESGINVSIYNSIIFGNTPNRIWSNNASNTISVHNSIIQGGQSSVINAQTTWGAGNLSTDPLFLDDDETPYQLSEGSPAINAGTLNINFPDYIWPTTDILGNPRVSGTTVDMGAYEYQEPMANFTATPLFGEVPLTVQFTDLSTGEPITSWHWSVNSVPFSQEQNPSYTFTEPGIYSIKLIINRSSELVRPDYIDAQPTSESDYTLPAISDITSPYPNPFRGRTMFKVTINDDGRVAMNIYNVKGQKVRTLVNEHKSVGIYQIVWDGRNDKGAEVASGIYTIELKHGGKKVGVTKVSYIK